MNKFKIICLSYNNEQWVETHINSILTQTYKNYEVIYVDDGSTDCTYDILNSLVGNNNKFKIYRNKQNVGNGVPNYFNIIYPLMKDDEILVHLDGDDWFANDYVLEKLDEEYTKHDYWLTYGGMVVWKGGEILEMPYPQNTEYSEFVHKYQLYRRDLWRASHLHTFRWFLYKNLTPESMTSKINNEYFYHASDLQVQFSLMEMCPIHKIGRIDDIIYVYNNSNVNVERTLQRENIANAKYEEEIRNKKKYKRVTSIEELRGELLPQVNVFGYDCEHNSIPLLFSYVYNRTYGDFDITLIQDYEIPKYINGEIKINQGKIIADLHESPELISNIYDLVYDNYDKFNAIVTWNEKLLSLPNAKLRFPFESVLNKNIHTKEWPLLVDNSLHKIYEKSKKISCIVSNKSFLPGHINRLQLLSSIDPNKCDLYGHGINPIVGKIEGLKEYMFSIAVENSYTNNYMTEKLVDCFLTGTIPIYYGCPNVGKYFDINGIIQFNTKEELDKIINDLHLNSNEIYNSKIDAIKNNYELANKWLINGDRIFNLIFKKLIDND